MDEKQAFIKFLQADKCSVEEFALARKYAKEQSSIEVEQIFNKLYAIVKNVLEEVVASNYRSVHDAKYIYIRWGISDDYFDKVLHSFLKKNYSLSITRRYYKTIKDSHSIDLVNVYNDLKKHFWSGQYDKQLALKYGYTFLEFNFLITYYAQEKHNIPFSSFKEYQAEYVAFYKMISNQIKSRVDKEQAYNYLKNYASLKEKETVSEFISLGQIYAHNIINTDLYQQVPHKNFTSRTYQTLERIMRESDPNVIKKELIDKHITSKNIIDFCYLYHSEYSKEKQDDLEVKLLNYLAEAKTEEQAKVLEIPQNILDLLNTYVKSGINLEACCNMYQYSFDTVKDYFKKFSNNSIVRQANEKYKLEREAVKKNKALYYHKLYLQLFNYIKNGIMVNGVKRDFTLIDYFCLFPDAKLHTRKMYMTYLTNEEKMAISLFFAPLSLAKDLFAQDLINTTFEYNTLKDENGLPVINSGTKLNQDDIGQIVDYFEQHSIPLNTVTLNVALQLYATNSLFLNEDDLQIGGNSLK